MNPWQSLRNEISGAVRSIRYDIAARKARRRMNEATIELPVIKSNLAKRQLFVAALVPVAGVSGYLAMGTGVDALFSSGGAPNGLPHVAAKPAQVTSPAQAMPAEPRMPATVGRRVPKPTPTLTPPRGTIAPTGSPPVPTPAPTCHCPTKSPTPPTPSTSPSPSPTPSASPTS